MTSFNTHNARRLMEHSTLPGVMYLEHQPAEFILYDQTRQNSTYQCMTRPDSRRAATYNYMLGRIWRSQYFKRERERERASQPCQSQQGKTQLNKDSKQSLQSVTEVVWRTVQKMEVLTACRCQRNWQRMFSWFPLSTPGEVSWRNVSCRQRSSPGSFPAWCQTPETAAVILQANLSVMREQRQTQMKNNHMYTTEFRHD